METNNQEIFYKFIRQEEALPRLANRQLKFSRISTLNDPFECTPILKEPTLEDAHRFADYYCSKVNENGQQLTKEQCCEIWTPQKIKQFFEEKKHSQMQQINWYV